MTKKKDIFHYCFHSLFFLLILSVSPVFAQSTNNNPWVKIQNGNLWVLSSDNVTYQPYLIKGVGYEPIPIGRYPSDWGYPPTDPRSANNNMYDDPEILNRDFSLLQKMNANTIRIWKGDKTTISCQCTNNGRYPNYMTNASMTVNQDTTQNTLDLAAHYGLKIIAGFWVNKLTFDANNNIGSTDDNGNPLNSQQIINNFVNYVDTFKGNRAILFWSIGNENNYQIFNTGIVPITAFENAFGLQYGDTIFNWLQQTANFIDFDGDIIADFNSPAILDILMAQYPSNYNSILNVLQPYMGQKMTPQQLSAWYALVDQMARAAHLAEDPTGGKNYHPVAIVNGKTAEIGNAADGATDAQLPDLDIWGTNVYLGPSFGTLFSDYAAKSHKPLWISEYGVDAWSVTNATGVNDWGNTLGMDLQGAGVYDPTTQSTWEGELSSEILNNSSVTIGGTIMEYSDEWWKPYEFYCTNPNNGGYNNSVSAGICNTNQKYFGFPFPLPTSPDGFSNEEWYGIVSISQNPVIGGADIVSPRLVYNNLQTKWLANPWATLTLNMSGSGTGSISSSSALGAGLNCNFSSPSSTGVCSASFTPNQPVSLTFSSSNNSTVTNWGVGGCVSGSTTCIFTPATNSILNVTVASTSATAVSLTSPNNNASFTAPASIVLAANPTAAVNATISSVSFYNGTTLLGTVTGSPYTYAWNNVAVGTYSLTAVVTDSAGVKATSPAVSVTVNILQTFTITANAASGGTISPSGSVNVNSGSSQTFTLTPNTGYTAHLTVDGAGVTLTNNTYTLSNVTAAHTLAAAFTSNNNSTYVITATAGNGGTISPSGTVTVNSGSSQTFTVNPNVGYAVQLTLDGTVVSLTNNTYTLGNVTAAHTLAAIFTQITYRITATAGSNGSISPTSVAVAYNNSQTFTVTPNTGYTAHLTVDGASVQLLYNNTYTLAYVTATHALAATFTQNTYTVTAGTSGNGTITPASATVPYGGSQIYTLTPNAGYAAGLTVDGTPVALTNNTYTLSNVTTTHNLVAAFTQNTYTITATAGGNGNISPTNVTVPYGSTQAFTLTPNTGYTAHLTLDGTAVTLSNNTYTLSNITSAHTLSATFTNSNITYVITATAGSNGSISPTSATVPSGGSQTFTVTPNTGYTAHLTVDGTSVTLTNNTYTLSNVTAAHALAAAFTLNNNSTYVITATAGSNGAISPMSVTVASGGSQTFTLTPNAGYSAILTVDGAAVSLNNNTYTLSNVTAAHLLAATFTPNNTYYVITANAGSGGTISPSGTVSVHYGSSQTFTVNPDPGYTVQLALDGTVVALTNNTYTLSNVTAAHLLAATFTKITYILTASAGSNGSISPTSVVVPYNNSQTFTVTPNAGYTGHLTVDGSPVQLLYNNTYTLGYVTAAHTLAATFTQNTYNITASTSGNGVISPANATVAYGGSQTFTLTPNAGYSASLTVDGAVIALTNNTYTLSNVTGAHILVATFTNNK